jgi:hypothetical protein
MTDRRSSRSCSRWLEDDEACGIYARQLGVWFGVLPVPIMGAFGTAVAVVVAASAMVVLVKRIYW